MKLRYTAAAAALLALAAPSVASADDSDLNYEQVTRCAAFNMLMMQVFSVGDDADKHKTEVETYTNQAAALTVLGSVMSKKEVKDVQAEVSTQNDAMIKSLSDKTASDQLLKDNLETCTVLGKAAYEAIQEVSKKK